MPYAEVIIPRPLEGTFTYSVPDELADTIGTGSRVIVPFGPRRYCTGIVEQVLPVKPAGDMALKEIVMVLDPKPIIRHPQLRFWHWLSDYYLCPLGDVMNAALPSSLKVESETILRISPDADMSLLDTFTERERELITFLGKHEKASAREIERAGICADATSVASRLVESGIVTVHESLVNRYKAVKTTFYAPTIERYDPEAQAAAFELLKRSDKQQRAMMALLSLTDFHRPDAPLKELTRETALEKTGLTSSVFQQLEKKGLCRIYTREVSRFTYTGPVVGSIPELSAAQGEALSQIHESMLQHNVTLLHGVTSSGKTEIYIHLIDYVLRRGDQALMLVPEIALTTQLTVRLQRVFGERVVIYHSKFSDNERVELWRRLLDTNEPLVVLGARSAIFLPYARLGLVIVDEEHESSYKQQDPAPRYNGRDAAIMLASMHGAKTLLGSATPSIETYYKAQIGKYGLVELSERYGGVKLPEVEVIDMSAERKRGAVSGNLSMPLVSAVRHTIDDHRQSILFINRRGFSPFARCRLCQFVPKCDHCDVSLTYHRSPEAMVCHYCGAVYAVPRVCPSCHEPAIEIVGYGTERVADDISNTFPEARILRMDLDTTRAKDAYSDIIDRFSEGKADLLVGTQMVTKGLDFSRVTTVGILSSDMLINYPDFRSAERAYCMISQVAGRAGRRSDRGRVLIQTSQPEHPVIRFAAAHDYRGFYDHEIEERNRWCYPPFCRVIMIYIRHRDRNTAEAASAKWADRLRQLLGNRVNGPEEPRVSRVQAMYIRRIMLKIENGASVSRVKEILRSVYVEMLSDPAISRATIHYDVDPG